MSEDEGTNASAQGVPSEDRSDDGETADAESEVETETQAEAEETTSDESTSESVTDRDASQSDAETGADLRHLADEVAEYDDELADRVESIVEEHEDLSERVETQAETIDDLQNEVDDLESRLKRKQADFQNYKKRAKKRQQQIKDRATEDLVERLVGVRDNLTRALEEESGDVESLREGLEMTLREFDRVLEDEDVSEIDPEPGAEVDPQRHEVMMQVDSAEPEGTIADVYTSGYEMGEKVIQNAQVTVSNGELEERGDEDEADAE